MELENKTIEIKGKGIRVHVLSGIFIALGVIIMVASFFVIRRIYDKYDEMRNSYQSISVEREAAVSFQVASDYLTEQARTYAATGDVQYAANYFEEKNVIKNREAALEVVKSSHMLNLENELLEDAMVQSEALVDYELHAMKLTAAATNSDPEGISEELTTYALTEAELSLDSEAQKAQAVQLLHGKEYEAMKERIDWDIQNATVLIEEELGARYRENEDDLIIALNIATLLIFMMFILLVLIFIFTVLLVVRPADRFIEALDRKVKLPEIGCYEFRKFARRYNDVYRSDQRNQTLLMEQGEIDPLTGTLKAALLEPVKHNLSQSKDPIGIMLVDIDNFRSIKEANGYDAADLVVAKVSKLFTSAFKKSDYIIRVSQDEFELFLLRMKEEDAGMLTERIAGINQKLQDTSDAVPAATVSVGVAFSECGYTTDAERKADMALNYVKENGRGQCRIAE